MFRSVTGISCPGCGMGRASMLLAEGKFYEAFLMHPLAIPFTLFAMVAIAWIITDIFRKKETFLPLLMQKMNWPYFIALIVVIVGVWVWNIIKAF